jgi:crotonobetainyl-CoA:carnitine CoA-transferase CaiB-like acyl-CoA transferase
MTSTSLLRGIKVVSLAINTPGPVAAARLAGMGAAIVKVEPPAGDPLKTSARPWYDALCRSQTVVSLDLKDPGGRMKLDDLLADADLLIVSFRPSALRRLGLDCENLHARHPRLCCVGIIGYPAPRDERSGHDLTYLADTGLLSPPVLPRSLFVDLAGAENCVSLALALLLNFSRTGEAACGFVSLYECAQDLAQPFQAGLTAPGGVLSGDFPLYSVYQASDGWIAIAALEPHFASGLISELGLSKADRPSLEKAFRSRSAADWEAWALERGLPLAKVSARSSQ